MGVRQLNNVLAIVKNYERVNELTKIGNESMGQGEIAQDKWANSLEGRLDALTGKLQIFWQNFISSEFAGSVVSGLGGIIDGLTKMESVLGGTTMGVTALSMIFLSFGQNNMFKGMINEWSASLAKYIASSMNATKVVKALEVAEASKARTTQASSVANGVASTTTNVFTASTIGATVAVTALQIALTMGLSVAIGLVIGGITKAIGWLKDLGGASNKTAKELAEFNEESRGMITDLEKNSESTTALQGKMEKLQKTLSSTTDEKAKGEALKELNEVQKELAQLAPEVADGFDSEGNAIVTNIDLLNKYNILKQQEVQNKAQEWFATNKNTLATLDDIEAKKKQLQLMEEAKALGNNYTLEDSTITEKRYNGQTITKDVQVQKQFSDKEMKALREEVNSAVGLTADLTRNFSLLSDEQQEASGYTQERINSLIDGLTDGSTSATEMADAVNGVDEALQGAVGSIKDLTDSMDGANNKAEILKTAMEEYAELGALTYETQKKMMDTGDNNIISLLADKNTFMEKANGLYGEQIALRDKERDQIIDLSTLELNKQAMVELGNQRQLELVGELLDANSDSYQADMENFESYLNGKAKLNNITIEALGVWLDNLVDGNIVGYRDDLKNSASWAEAKAKILKKLNDQIATVKGAMNVVAESAKNPKFGFQKDYDEKMLSGLQGQLDSLNGAIKEVDTNFSGMSGNFISSANALDKVGVGGKVDTGSKPDKESGSKKEDARYKVNLEQWYKLNDAIEDNNNALDRNRAKQENATGKEKIDLMSQEITLLEKQVSLNKQLQGEMEKSRNELKQYIASRGGQFDGENLTNYESLLGGEAVGDEAIASLKELEEAVKSYTDLCNNQIPGVISEWEKLANEIKSIKENQLQIAIDFEQNMYNAIEHYARKEHELRKKDIEAEKKAIGEKKKLLEERKKILQESFDKEGREDAIADGEQTLNDLDAQIQEALRSGDKELAKRLREQYAEQQKALNEKIRDQERDDALKELDNIGEGYDKEIEDLDDIMDELDQKLEEYLSPENMNKIMEQALQSGVVNIMGQTVDLSKLMGDFLKDTTVGVYTTRDALKELEDKLKDIGALTSQLPSIADSLGLPSLGNAGRMGGRSVEVGASQLVLNSPLVNIEKLDSDSIGDFNDLMNEKMEWLMDKLNAKFAY